MEQTRIFHNMLKSQCYQVLVCLMKILSKVKDMWENITYLHIIGEFTHDLVYMFITFKVMNSFLTVFNSIMMAKLLVKLNHLQFIILKACDKMICHTNMIIHTSMNLLVWCYVKIVIVNNIIFVMNLVN